LNCHRSGWPICVLLANWLLDHWKGTPRNFIFSELLFLLVSANMAGGPDMTCNFVFWSGEAITILESMVPMGGRFMGNENELLSGGMGREFNKKVLFLINCITNVRFTSISWPL
jgi:hypothetical protein